jgi:uncharacterized protein (TIGR03437 family)
MQPHHKRIMQIITMAAAPVAIYAFSSGPVIMRTGAPVDGGLDCTACHRTLAPANSGMGRLTIKSAPYVPGAKQQITVTIEDPDAARWGFQITARLRSDQTKQAGTFSTSDFVRVRCAPDGADGPCSGALEFAEHTLAGTRPGSGGPGVFTIDWTPPAQASGEIIFYAAGNAANNNNTNSGDRIYTNNLVVPPASAQGKPSISSTRGVLNAASFDNTISPNSWVTIFGTNLASSIRTWRVADIIEGKLPTQLEGVSATINGKAASIYYISPEQLNVLAPPGLADGQAQVRVTASGNSTDVAMVQVRQTAPAFFMFKGKYVVATHANGDLIDTPAPATASEMITIYASGLGDTNPQYAEGRIIEQPLRLSGTPQVQVGGRNADVQSAMLISAGVYQLIVKLPDTLTAGDVPVVLTMGGARTQENAAILAK